jgi:hypothetical protein
MRTSRMRLVHGVVALLALFTTPVAPRAAADSPLCSVTRAGVLLAAQGVPTGPCQCWPGCDYSVLVIDLGATSCAEVGSRCSGVVSPYVSCHQGCQDRGSVCNKTVGWTNCRRPTCNGVPCGYEVDCYAVWGCYYCD